MEQDQFGKLVTNTLNKALAGEVKLFKFINPHQQAILKQIAKNKAFVYFDGGYEDSEYKRALISGLELEKPDFKIVILKINYNRKFLKITHPIILGNLMHLGLQRDAIGDIVVADEAYIVSSKEIIPFLIQEFKFINNMPISLEEVSQIMVNKAPLKDEIHFVNSLRLDLIIAKVCKLSRKEALEYIKNDNVKVNYEINNNHSYLVNQNDVLVVRGFGKFLIKEIGGLSKGNNICLKISKY